MRILGFLLSFLIAITSHAQLTHRDDVHRFTIVVPKGWVESPDLLNFMNSFVKEKVVDPGFEYVAAFVPESNVTDDSPYVVVQYSPLPTGGTTYEAVEAALKAQSLQTAVEKNTVKVKDELGKFEVGVPTLDRGTNRVYLRIHGGGEATQPDQPPSQKFDSLCVGTLTSHGIIQINSYAIEGSGVDPVAQAETFLTGLKIDEGTKFTPLTVGQAHTTGDVVKGVAKNLGKKLLQVAVIAVIVTVLALIWAFWKVGREKKQQS